MMASAGDPLLLADSRPAGDWALGARRWRPLEVCGLGPADRELWRALAGDRPAWTAPLQVPGIWQRLVIVDTAAESQFEVLQRLGGDLAGIGPVACLALTGREFRGLRDRSWEALRGNLHLSLALQPRTDVQRLGVGLSMLPAVAVVDAVLAASGGAIRPGIKWVNDLLLEERKVAGVLTATQVKGGQVEQAALGIGLNLERAPALPWTPFVPEAGCLRQHPAGASLSPWALLEALLSALDRRYRTLLDRGPGELLSEYRQGSVVLGRRVKIWDEGSAPPDPPAREGVARAIGEDLALFLEGQPQPVTRGRLALARALQSATQI
jgi:BirA family biotin operon repressor/biotin-[acetyl-CoA-carboxylase] ligase